MGGIQAERTQSSLVNALCIVRSLLPFSPSSIDVVVCRAIGQEVKKFSGQAIRFWLTQSTANHLNNKQVAQLVVILSFIHSFLAYTHSLPHFAILPSKLQQKTCSLSYKKWPKWEMPSPVAFVPHRGIPASSDRLVHQVCFIATTNFSILHIPSSSILFWCCFSSSPIRNSSHSLEHLHQQRFMRFCVPLAVGNSRPSRSPPLPNSVPS